MFEIDSQDLLLRLPPETLGLFEPVSGIMLLNAPDSAFEEMRATSNGEPGSLREVFFHEAFHCFQTYCTGYQFRQLYDLVGAMSKHMTLAQLQVLDLLRHVLTSGLDQLYPWAPWEIQACLSEATRSWYRAGKIAELERVRARTGASTISRGDFPGLHENVQRVYQRTEQRGRDGMGALDIIEGSAVLYARASCTKTTPRASELLTELEAIPGAYTKALSAAVTLQGEGAIAAFLPAAAIALRYERPGDAFLPILRRLTDAVENGPLGAARMVARDLPEVGAGERLGTAAKYAERLERRARFRPGVRRPPSTYDVQIQALRSGAWQIDELDLLTSIDAWDSIPPGSLGFQIVTRGGKRGFKRGFAPLLHAVLMLGQGPSIAQTQRELQRASDRAEARARRSFIDARAMSSSFITRLSGSVRRPLSLVAGSRRTVTAMGAWVGLYRRLAARSTFFKPLLAGSLMNLGDALIEVGEEAESCRVTMEGGQMLQELAAAKPAFLPSFATALVRSSKRLHDTGDALLAQLGLWMARDRFQVLTNAMPDVFAPQLASTLSTLAESLRADSDEDDDREAFALSVEAAELYGALARNWPSRFATQFAASIDRLRAYRLDSSEDLEQIAVRERAAAIMAMDPRVP